MRKKKNQFKQGAASFFIVALSTLILMILAASFAAVIVSNMTRTSNDELSQSAYDAALAGVEDAKLAFANYKKCLQSGVTTSSGLSSGANVTCQDIVYWMEHPDCDMVAHMIGRLGKTAKGEVALGSSTTNGVALDQAYTCVTLSDNLNDYRSSITSSSSEKIVRVLLGDGVTADQIKKVRLKWHSQSQQGGFTYANFKDGYVNFYPTTDNGTSVPPTLQVQLIQADKTSFKLSHFTKQRGNSTDRATLYLVPTQSDGDDGSGGKVNPLSATNPSSSFSSYQTYILAQNGVIMADQVASTNFDDENDIKLSPAATGGNTTLISRFPSGGDATRKHLPFLVECNESDGYACSVDIDLPTPVQEVGGNIVGDGTRNDEMFMFVVSVPYGTPDTDFMMEFYCASNDKCSEQVITDTGEEESIARIRGVQVSVDSTGRANDLYRRIETRLESSDAEFTFSSYGIQLLANDGSSNIRKNFPVTSEYGTYPPFDYGSGGFSGGKN